MGMMETITLNSKEQKRLLVLNRVNDSKMTALHAAELLGWSERHVRRMLARYRAEGAEALAHGNRGRESERRIQQGQRSRIVSLARGPYAGVNQQHLSELLNEREQISVSRSTLRRILADAGIASPRPHRRRRRHRLRRERYPQEGMLVQIDGSRHDWLEGRGPRMTLLAAIDDATGKLLGAVFRPQEDAQGYFLLLRQITERHGRPLALYRDRHTIFEGQKKKLTIEEQLQGRPDSTQFGRLLTELDIRSIAAWSPQAKGRVERLFGTLQDRLVSELRLHKVSTLQQAQTFLDPFLPNFNKRFAVPAAESGTAFRNLPRAFNPDTVFVFKFDRIVSADNTVSLADHCIQLEPDTHRVSYARARVQLHIRMDGSLAVYFGQRCLKTTTAPAHAPQLRLRGLQTRRLKPSATLPKAKTKKAPSPFKPPRQWKPQHPSHTWYLDYREMPKYEPMAPAGDILADIFNEHLP